MSDAINVPFLKDFTRALSAVLEENDRLVKEVEALKSKGTDNRPKLTEQDVRRIREQKRGGWRVTELAELYDVNKSTISRILKGVYHK